MVSQVTAILPSSIRQSATSIRCGSVGAVAPGMVRTREEAQVAALRTACRFAAGTPRSSPMGH